ncbi:GIY-YIG nuclease family protein [Planctopirus hydrillae]|uniref:Bacteriophage T5 Orf172 DNA-binding domain-containing protein n=1 Tax=Planctopirus hydrillae TaxID=1841610 RepID=A0A1C3E5E5_9PLAN|nr:GIY-YIG nuclease family protein [Planctopirus hydrillae]ODA28467.1 hypothetical protein A6X21_12155 [Planctopirus hydrillae]
MSLWEVVAGTKKGGPFTRVQLEQLSKSNRLSANAFVRNQELSNDWSQVITIDWLNSQPEPSEVRYCAECDCRLVVSQIPREKQLHCPNCEATGQFISFGQQSPPLLEENISEPWGRFDVIIFAAAAVVILAGVVGAFAIFFQPVLAVLFAFILLASGGALFAITFEHRSRCDKYFRHLTKVETLLDQRSAALRLAHTELNTLKRNLDLARKDTIDRVHQEFEIEREKITALRAKAEQDAAAVDRIADEYLKNVTEWWLQKLTGENFELTKTRILKAITFCRKCGYEISPSREKEEVNKLKDQYKLVIRREHEKAEQRRIKEQIKEQQKVERDLKREMERAAAEKQVIERAIEEALRRQGNEHSSEIQALRAKLADAEARGIRARAQAEMTRVGHVYVISNIGSFGKDTYKVGLTRRLDPNDRVKELGDASVPFPFDVHMMIFSEDAPRLEHTLHRALHRHRINRVNFRKEFFKVDLQTIRDLVEQHHGRVEYTLDAEAMQYYQSLETSDSDLDFFAEVAEDEGLEDDDDDADGLDEVISSDDL